MLDKKLNLLAEYILLIAKYVFYLFFQTNFLNKIPEKTKKIPREKRMGDGLVFFSALQTCHFEKRSDEKSRTPLTPLVRGEGKKKVPLTSLVRGGGKKKVPLTRGI